MHAIWYSQGGVRSGRFAARALLDDYCDSKVPIYRLGHARLGSDDPVSHGAMNEKCLLCGALFFREEGSHTGRGDGRQGCARSHRSIFVRSVCVPTTCWEDMRSILLVRLSKILVANCCCYRLSRRTIVASFVEHSEPPIVNKQCLVSNT